MSRGSFSLRFARNAGFIVAARLWSILAWILVTPFVLHHLGPERFGVWSLLFLLSGYLATFDLGLGASVVKFTAQHAAAGGWERLRATLAEITRLYLLLGILWVVLLFAFCPWILDWLRIPAAYRQEVRFAVLASGVVFAFANLVSVGIGVLNGIQRMDIANGIAVAASIPQLLILVVGVARGYGLYAVVASTAVNWLVIGVLTHRVARRLAPEAGWPSLRAPGVAGGWFRFSSIMQVINVLNLTQLQVDKILLTTWIGLTAVTQFELGFRVANAVQSLPVLALGPLMPAFAEIDGQGDRERLRDVCRRGMSLLIAGSFGLAACAIPAAPLAVRAWVGPQYPVSETIAQWLLAAFAVNLCTAVGTAALRGAGRPGLEVGPGLLALAVHVGASAFLIRRLGTVGVGPALFVAMVVWCVVFLARFTRWLGEPAGRLLAPPLVRSGAAAVPALLAGLWMAGRWPGAWATGRTGLLGGAGVVVIAGGGIFAALWWALGRVRGLSPVARRG